MWFRYLLLCCMFLLLILAGSKGYNFQQSDWSKSPDLDYATNRTSANYYGTSAEWYRVNKFDGFYLIDNDYYLPIEIYDKIKTGNKVLIGVDYYCQLAICAPIVPSVIRRYNYSNGEVYYFELYITGNSQLIWSMIPEKGRDD